MTEHFTGDLVTDAPAETPSGGTSLVDQVAEVLTLATARGADVTRQAAWVVTYLDTFLDPDVQLRQTAAAMSTLVDAYNRLDEIAGRRAAVAGRLRAELHQALDDAEQYRALTPQSCPAGLHDGWLVDSEHDYACPWCLINELRGDDQPAVALPSTALPVAGNGCQGCDPHGVHIVPSQRCTVGERS